jgi:hypothetical protein
MANCLQPVLAANIADLIEPAIVIILMIMGAASHLLSSKPKANPPVRQRPAPPPPNPGAAGGQGGQPMTLEESLRREVEEFMRRAQGREPAPPPKQAPQQAPQRLPSQRTPPPRPAASRPPARPAPQRPPERRAATSSPAEPTVRRLTDAPGAQTTAQSPTSTAPLGAGVGQHVAEHLGGSQALAAHAQSLGANVATADERMVAHLQQKFTHQVGALQHQGTTTQTRAVRPPAAQALVDLLQQPGGMRQVVLASEILRRPEERWERTGT